MAKPSLYKNSSYIFNPYFERVKVFFANDISPNVNVIERIEFKYTYFKVTVLPLRYNFMNWK